MIVNRASLVGVVFRLAVFYWAVCTLVFVGEDITRVPELLLAYPGRVDRKGLVPSLYSLSRIYLGSTEDRWRKGTAP
jgi:hypothetical protein